jgi:hypothetical protein
MRTLMRRMAMPKLMVSVLMVLIVAAADAAGQGLQRPPEIVNLEGPRVGVTFLSDGVRERLQQGFRKEVGPAITQFGWQKEKRFLSSPDGFTGVTEFVGLVGGMDQGLLIPSFNWMVGVRTAGGVEFAAGPNLTPWGTGMAAAAGVTFKAGNLNVPLNFAAVRSRSGVRVSVLAGFNARRR